MLSDAKARKIKPSDKPLADGTVTGLYLFPAGSVGAGKWILRFKSPEMGKRRDMGLGSYPVVSLKDARELALQARKLIEAGRDPLAERDRQLVADRVRLAMPSFEEAARQLHADLAPGFRNQKHAAQWITTLETYVFPVIGKLQVSHLTAADFARVLKPIWLSKQETASRVKQRCDQVMKWCAANDHVVASPASVVAQLLTKQSGKRERVEHHPAVPWRDVPLFVRVSVRHSRLIPGSRQSLAGMKCRHASQCARHAVSRHEAKTGSSSL
ncbi:tyrosine-type recombinase/integrase [Roseibium aestuarii]|uniref:Tyrosine-type recombinase/integrase n=2 Tax=Roseibium aestuarii TaxID=2600299 RepID=A0ABW4JQ01_9HYPH|nr:integrase arm-type DNA-binding domain-containing protein [Roseibium aestuarii]